MELVHTYGIVKTEKFSVWFMLNSLLLPDNYAPLSFKNKSTPLMYGAVKTQKFSVWFTLNDLLLADDFAESKADIESKEPRTTCAFCLRTTVNLQRSHYLPVCVLKRIGQNVESFEVSEDGLTLTMTKSAKSNERRWAKWLFCDKCEKHFFGDKFEAKLSKNMKVIPGLDCTLLLSTPDEWLHTKLKDFKPSSIPAFDKSFWASVLFRSLIAYAGKGLHDWEWDYILRLYTYLKEVEQKEWSSAIFPEQIKMAILVDVISPVIWTLAPLKSQPNNMVTRDTVMDSLRHAEYNYRFFSVAIVPIDDSTFRLNAGHITGVLGPGIERYFKNGMVFAIPEEPCAKSYIEAEYFDYAKDEQHMKALPAKEGEMALKVLRKRKMGR